MKILFIVFVLSAVLFAQNKVNKNVKYPIIGKQYKTMSFSFEENLNFNNPFDIVKNKVELEIQQPDKSFLTLSFFYNGINEKNIERWEARFSPKQFGIYKFRTSINGIFKDEFEIAVKENKDKKQGGLILSENLGLFKFESGGFFRGIGENICWANDYEYYFKKMLAAGMNITRIWMSPWHLSFEWNDTGLGRYNLVSANRLDEVLYLAEKYNVYIILCMDYHGIGQKRAGFFNENKWLENPYNEINGGPSKLPEELFTNEEAKNSFKKKYKYIVSRYGHSSRIASWEFYNEADLMAGKSIPVNKWHIEMAEYIKSIDINKRLVSTSSTRNFPEKVIDAFKSPAIDFVMFHDYNKINLASYTIDLIDALVQYYNKPVVIGEFGVEYRGGDRTYTVDPQHIGLHNGIWAGLFSETPIIPLSWWWDNYIDNYDFWYEYNYLSKFSEKINLNDDIKFCELSSGSSLTDSTQQVPCLVRCIYFDDNAALWLKNEEYQWVLFYEGKLLKPIDSFEQIIPDMPQGKYSVCWYDPQSGVFFDKPLEVTADKDGNIKLLVPSFTKDLSCIISKIK
jgi:hypothetical protein